MKKILLILIACRLSLIASAQEETLTIRYGDCTPVAEEAPTTRGTARRLPPIKKDWDAERVYRQMVILLEFRDSTFTTENPHDYYDALLNQPGFSKLNSKGCMADYFRDQSGGLFNLKFDVYGPVKVSQKAQPYGKPTASTRNFGRDALAEATKAVLAQNPDVDYSQYDWDGDGSIEQVIYIYASLPGNSGEPGYGFIWPNTNTLTSTITTPDGKIISNYSCSGEHWPTRNKTLCGFGTIAHEFSHCLGLPDIYMTDGTTDNIVVDTWDLMDGGNVINYGFCPPHYTALEKMLLGWLQPQELTEAMTEDGLKYGTVYQIKNTDDDYYLLENRQQEGWDEGVPGEGLVIYHVRYNELLWMNNAVNQNAFKRFDIIHADGLDYYDWQKKIADEKLGVYSPNRKGSAMNFNALSTSPFPYLPKEGDAVASFEAVEGKAVTNIQRKGNGEVTFDFMGGATAVREVRNHITAQAQTVYDIMGRKVTTQRRGQLYIVRDSDGSLRKSLAK